MYVGLCNLFVPDTPFLYPLKTSENLKVFWYFQGVKKGCIGDEWVKFFNEVFCLTILWVWQKRNCDKHYSVSSAFKSPESKSIALQIFRGFSVVWKKYLSFWLSGWKHPQRNHSIKFSSTIKYFQFHSTPHRFLILCCKYLYLQSPSQDPRKHLRWRAFQQ